MSGIGGAANDRASSRTLARGMADSVLSSLATFLVGLGAVRYLSADELGLYGLLFGGFVLAAIAPAQLICTPAEIAVVSRPALEQLHASRRTLRLAATPAVASALMACAVALAVAPDIGTTRWAMAAGALVTAAVSPLQDHVRRMFHQIGRSGTAVEISGVALATVVIATVALHALGLTDAAIPFGSLALANVASLGWGLRRMHAAASPVGAPGEVHVALALGRLTRFGGWLAWAGLTAYGATFVSGLLVASLADAEALGFYEATRVLSQPLYVLSAGAAVVLRPILMRAAIAGQRREARRISGSFAVGIVSAGGVLALAVGGRWPRSPLPELFPNAYAQRHLLALVVVASAVNYATVALQGHILVLGRARQFAMVNLGAAIAQIIVVLAVAHAWRSFAIPISLFVYAGVAWAGYETILRRAYTTSEPRPGDTVAGRLA